VERHGKLSKKELTQHWKLRLQIANVPFVKISIDTVTIFSLLVINAGTTSVYIARYEFGKVMPPKMVEEAVRLVLEKSRKLTT